MQYLLIRTFVRYKGIAPLEPAGGIKNRKFKFE